MHAEYVWKRKGTFVKNLRFLRQLDLDGKTVFCRLDLNVPVHEGVIQDDTRVAAALPTIEYLLEKANKLVVASHLGRPKGARNAAMSLEPVAGRLAELTGYEVAFVSDYEREPIDQLLMQLSGRQFVVLENLRFFPGETANDGSFAEILMKGVDVYVNDAFGAVHRSHASIVAAADLIPPERRAAGFLIEKEIENLSKLGKPKRPYVVVVGGAKVSDKIDVILNLLNTANDLVVGGAMAYTFLAHAGIEVGNSRVERDKFSLIDSILTRAKERGVKIHLPCDHECGADFSADTKPVTTTDAVVPEGLMGLDIGPQTRRLYQDIIGRSQTVLWNGPMGVFEWEAFSQGTRSVAQAVANCPGFTLVGGGDSVAALNRCKLADRVSHVSTGGGASLEYLEGASLPGLRVLST